MNIQIKYEGLLHKDETKFYSVYEIRATDGSKSITVAGYGSIPKDLRHTDKVPKPAKAGKIVTHMGIGKNLVYAKSKRGYAVVEEETYTTSLDAIRFDQVFGKFAQELRLHFTSEVSPSSEVQNTVIATEKVADVRPAGWGSW